MSGMHVALPWTDIGIRLLLTLVAGLLIGYDRSEHGKTAGMRTTLLVALAAAAAMIEVNLLLPTSGRPPHSFVMNDLMRLPLGILTGVGFIGAGVILRRENVVVGVTTAATLWLITVIGLIFGGGQLGLGAAVTALGILALQGLRWIEGRLRRECRARFLVTLDDKGLSESDLRRRLDGAGLAVLGSRTTFDRINAWREVIFEIREIRLPEATEAPPIVTQLARESGVVKLQWDGLS